MVSVDLELIRLPHDERNANDMDHDVDGIGVVCSIESELEDACYDCR